MSMTDPIADLLTQIRNAHLAKHDRLDVPASRLKLEVVKLLKEEGFIKNLREIDAPAGKPGSPVSAGRPGKKIRIFLRYDAEGTPAISHLARISRPGRRVYRRAGEVVPVRNGLGTGIVSTSQGLLTDSQARERGVGGELLCEVW